MGPGLDVMDVTLENNYGIQPVISSCQTAYLPLR